MFHLLKATMGDMQEYLACKTRRGAPWQPNHEFFPPPTPTTTIFPEPWVLMAVFWFPASTSSSPGICPFHHPRWLQALLVFPTELSSFSFLQSVKCKCLKNATATFRKRFISEMILKVTAYYRNIFCSERRKLPIQFPLDSNFKKCWLSRASP